MNSEIIDIIADAVASIPKGECMLTLADGKKVKCPEINYTFGNGQYVKDKLDDMSKSRALNAKKFPLVALFCPYNERRDSPDYRAKAKVRVLIACATDRQYSNEQRKSLSFENILRPIYRALLEALRADRRLDFGYDGIIAHEYSENYSYGRYGAYADTGEKVSETIDAINITNLELTVKNFNCRRQ